MKLFCCLVLPSWGFQRIFRDLKVWEFRSQHVFAWFISIIEVEFESFLSKVSEFMCSQIEKICLCFMIILFSNADNLYRWVIARNCLKMDIKVEIGFIQWHSESFEWLAFYSFNVWEREKASWAFHLVLCEFKLICLLSIK